MSRPKCPNHAVEMDATNERHIWICPISGARFEVEVEYNDGEKKMVIDASGNMVEQVEYKLTPLDGAGG